MTNKLALAGAEPPDSGGPPLVEKFVIRLPAALRDQIRVLSEQKRRSMNSEILRMIQEQLTTEFYEKMLSVNGNETEFFVKRRTKEELESMIQALPADRKKALKKLLL